MRARKPRQTHPGEVTGTDPLCPVCGFVCACACHWDEEGRYQEVWDVQFRMEEHLREREEEIEGLRARLRDLADVLAPALETLIDRDPNRADWDALTDAVGLAADMVGPPDEGPDGSGRRHRKADSAE